MNSYIEPSYIILSKVFKEKSYSTIALNFSSDTNDATTKIVYGVLERNIELDYIINLLCEKPPKQSIQILLKIAAYCLLYMDRLPNYAIVNETVELTKKLGKSGVSGFVNAVLQNIAKRNYTLPKENEKNYLSVKYSKPQWFIEKLISTYGKENALSILNEPNFEEEHIRINSRKTKFEIVKNTLKAQTVAFEQSEAGGLIVKNTDEIKAMFNNGLVTYMSPSSMLAVKALNVTNGGDVLDLCAAPGGKAVMIAEQNPNSRVVAGDLYPHRVKLISLYKKRMGTQNITEMQNDALKFNKDFERKFDYVLVDAPCSCFGTFRKHPDVFLQHDENSISIMQKMQRAIMDNAKHYVKEGGVLLYSTCTLFNEENKDVIDGFLEKNKDFKKEKISISKDNDGTLTVLPKEEWDGFFIARLRHFK